jgi:Methyltransferase domain
MRVERIARWIAHTSPSLHRLVLPPWRQLKRWLPLADPAAAERLGMKYYDEVARLAQTYVPHGGQVVDVGAGATDMLRRLPWFARRVALDRSYAPRYRGVETVLTDFLQYEPDGLFDLVLCLEVLEHLEDPAPFAQKLLRTGYTAIISVPYKWPKGACVTHVQDPVDEALLEQWTGRQPTETRIVVDGRARLIAVYHSPQKNGTPAS